MSNLKNIKKYQIFQNQIEIIRTIYRVFLKWSPAPLTIPGWVKKLPRGKTNQPKNKLFRDFHDFYEQNYKNPIRWSQNVLEMVPKWSPAPLPIPG